MNAFDQDTATRASIDGWGTQHDWEMVRWQAMSGDPEFSSALRLTVDVGGGVGYLALRHDAW